MGDQNTGKYVPTADQHEEMCKQIALLTKQRDELVALLECMKTNLSKGMSKSIQRLQAEAIEEALTSVKGQS